MDGVIESVGCKEFGYLSSTKFRGIIKKALGEQKGCCVTQVTNVFIMLVHTPAVLMVGLCSVPVLFGPALSCHTVCSAQCSSARILLHQGGGTSGAINHLLVKQQLHRLTHTPLLTFACTDS